MMGAMGASFLGFSVRDLLAYAGTSHPAKAEQVLASDAVLVRLDPEQFEAGRRKRLRAPGAPRELHVAGEQPPDVAGDLRGLEAPQPTLDQVDPICWQGPSGVGKPSVGPNEIAKGPGDQHSVAAVEDV